MYRVGSDAKHYKQPKNVTTSPSPFVVGVLGAMLIIANGYIMAVCVTGVF